jgi:hypothetical protein
VSITSLAPNRRRAREIDFGQEGRGSFKSRRDGYGDVHFESALEQSVLSMLDSMIECVPWYMEQPLAIPYRTDRGLHTYYPDILLSSASGDLILVECKSLNHMYYLDTFEKGMAAQARAADSGWGYVMIDDRGLTIKSLIERRSHGHEDELVAMVRRRGGMRITDFITTTRTMGIGYTDGNSTRLLLPSPNMTQFTY